MANAGLLLGFGLPLLGSVMLGAAEVREPARSIPVMHEVDVVVVGGASGGVEAALSAAKAGARVFLAAPRPYLGEDICASDRLWLEPGEQPSTELARTLFTPQIMPEATPLRGAYDFTYTTDKPASARHPDTGKPPRLHNGAWDDASRESVEFGETTGIVLDLGQPRDIRQVVVMAYQRSGDFEVGNFTVSASADRQAWKELASFKNDMLDAGEREQQALRLTCPVSVNSRYLKLQVAPGARAKRILLGEIVVLGEPPASPALQPDGPQPVTPMQVKHTLDRALTGAKVPFLYPSVVTGVLRDDQGRLAGIIMANRSGRQAVIAKVMIDATDRAVLARMTSARFTPYPRGPQTFRRVVVDGPVRQADGVAPIQRSSPVTLVDRKGDPHTFLEYQLQIPLAGSEFPAFAAAEQVARDLTWTAESAASSETLFQVPPDSVSSGKPHTGAWPGAAQLPLDCLKPAGVENVFVLGGCAGVSREAAAQLVRPVNLMAVGARVGKAAAEQAAGMAAPLNVSALVHRGEGLVAGEVREAGPVSPERAGNRSVPASESALPVWGEYDVVVVGGGTAGAPASIAAGRQGAKTLLLEFLHELGGVGTAGLITKYYHGNRVGFTSEVDKGVAALAGGADTRTSSGGWSPEIKSEWYRRELRKAGVDIWFSAMGHGAVVENGRVTGVVVVTPMGRAVVRAKVVVDATGNADIATAAGAACRYTDGTEVSVQGAGLPPRDLGARYVNTDYLFVDDNDVMDIWRAFVTAREKYRGTYDLGQLVDTRERRQIVGDYTLTPMDIFLKRTFPDTVVISRSNFDSHGYTIHPIFMLRAPHREDLDAHVPYRCLLPRGLDGILVTGLGVSAHRDSIPIIRMQPDVQNQGYAAGVAAATVAKKGIATRDLDLKALQAHLVEIGNLPQTVLTNADSFPLPRARFVEAVAKVVNGYEDLEVLLTDVEAAKPLLREQLARSTGSSNRLVYAHVLGMLGDPAGAQILRDVVKQSPWDEGWGFRGGGQFGMSMSRLDSYIIALARTRDQAALPVLIEKAAALTAAHDFSHFRAIALALESFRDEAAARTLASLLQSPGVSGHALTSLEASLGSQQSRQSEDVRRGRELAELDLARALYRCGDHEGLGEKTLRQFALNLQGHHARHAQAVLRAGKTGGSN